MRSHLAARAAACAGGILLAAASLMPEPAAGMPLQEPAAGSLFAEPQDPQQRTRYVEIACPIAADPTYGYTPENPVLIGGGASTVAARERSYLQTLRGPRLAELSFRRLGSGQGPDGTILDHWEITSEALEEPMILYLDAYRWALPQVPVGLLCNGPFELTVPGPDPFGMAEDPGPPRPGVVTTSPPGLDPRVLSDYDDELNQIAVEYALAGRTLEPIPLDPERPELGVGFTPLHRKVLVARAEAGAGATPDLPIEMGPGSPLRDGILLVAYPIECDGRTVRPREVAYVGMTRPGERGEVMVTSNGLGAAEIGIKLPGFSPPDGALGAAFIVRQFNRDDIAVIRYDEPGCDEIGNELRLPVDARLPRPIKQAHGPNPTGEPATVISVRALVDVDGSTRPLTVMRGPEALHEEALRLAAQWRWRPKEVNGVPLPMAFGFPIRFGPGR